MAARANMSLNDGQVTPVSRTFVPQAGDGNVPGLSIITHLSTHGATEADKVLLQESTRVPTKTNPNRKVGYLGKVPYVLEDGTRKAGTVRIEFVIPEDAPEAVRRDVYAYAVGRLAHATGFSAIVDLQSTF